MPSVLFEVVHYDDEEGEVETICEQRVFTDNFEGTTVLYAVRSVRVNPFAGSFAEIVCPYCGLSERVQLPTRDFYGHWGPAGPHPIRLECKRRTWHGSCDALINPEQHSRWAEDGVFEPGVVHVKTTKGSGWTVLTPSQSAAWTARVNAESSSDSD